MREDLERSTVEKIEFFINIIDFKNRNINDTITTFDQYLENKLDYYIIKTLNIMRPNKNFKLLSPNLKSVRVFSDEGDKTLTLKVSAVDIEKDEFVTIDYEVDLYKFLNTIEEYEHEEFMKELNKDLEDYLGKEDED